MIPEYINKWLTIIEQMNNDNTYKLAWGRSIIECVIFDKYVISNDKAIITFKDIAKCMIKYYWNQLFFFKLKQSPYKDKDPIICEQTNVLIEKWKQHFNSNIPAWYDENDVRQVDAILFDKTLKKVIKTLHENVSWRFLNISGEISDVYEYKKEDSTIEIKAENISMLKEYGIIISKLLNYKWAQLLEKYNYQPKIVSKVNGISENKIRRNSLKKYKDELIKQYAGKAVDFYTGKELEDNDISVDHVIPWSFMYSDDIWNLVLTSKSNNSSKSNSIPSRDDIKRLKERNLELINYVGSNYKKDLEEANNNDYVDKYYYECRL